MYDIEVFNSRQLLGSKGVRAKRDFTWHEKIFTVEGQLVKIRTLRTLQIDDEQHIDPVNAEGQPEFGYYLNHSCDPCAYALVTKTGSLPALGIYALKEIRKGQEITVDYAFMESEIANECICFCGAINCRRKLVGFKQLELQEIQSCLDKRIPVSAHLLNMISCRVFS